MTIKAKYFWKGPKPSKVVRDSVFENEIVEDSSKKNTSAFNPIFNFDQSFVDELQRVSTMDIARSIPYISLSLRNAIGEEIQNLNLDYFHNPVDLTKINQKDKRYPERPSISLKEIQIKTDLSAGGYYKYRTVSLKLRVHSFEVIASNAVLTAMLYPDIPVGLEYGWKSPNDFLGANNIERMLFQPKSYTFSIDTTGQVDMSIEGMSFAERFTNVYVGDIGQKIGVTTAASSTGEPAGTTASPAGSVGVAAAAASAAAVSTVQVGENKKQNITEQTFNGINFAKQRLDKVLNHLSKLVNTEQNTNEYDLLKERAESYEILERKARSALMHQFALDKAKLYKDVKQNGDEFEQGYVTLHDLIYTLCHETFGALTSLFKGLKSLDIVYGSFNEHAGDFANTSLADFPIDLKKFNAILKEKKSNGMHVLTLNALFTLLASEFMENDDYVKSFTKAGADYTTPDIEFVISNIGDDLQFHIFDVRSGIPVTTKTLAAQNKVSTNQAEKNLPSNFPKIRLGHANSFIKHAALSPVVDEGMKTALVARVFEERIHSLRSSRIVGTGLTSAPTNPLHLPLRGTLTLLGHTQWKPGRSIYLSVGHFLVDGVYRILSTIHTLSARGFETKIDIQFN